MNFILEDFMLNVLFLVSLKLKFSFIVILHFLFALQGVRRFFIRKTIHPEISISQVLDL